MQIILTVPEKRYLIEQLHEKYTGTTEDEYRIPFAIQLLTLEFEEIFPQLVEKIINDKIRMYREKQK